MKNLKGVSIIDLIEMNAADHDTEIFEIAKKTTDYNKYEKDIDDVLDYLQKNNKEYWSILDDATGMIEGIVKNVAFEQGFKTAIQLILSSVQ